jgi:hypothetical protein
VLDLAVQQAWRRLDAGERPEDVQEWLQDQATQASEDEAARSRWGRKAKISLSNDPAVTRASCARSLSRVAVMHWQQRRR